MDEHERETGGTLIPSSREKLAGPMGKAIPTEHQSLVEAVRQNIGENRVAWYSTQVGSLVIATVIVGLTEGFHFSALTATILSYLGIGSLVAFYQLVRTLNTIFTTNSIAINSLRTIVDSHQIEKREGEQRIRELYRGRLADSEYKVAASIATLDAQLKALLAADVTPDVTLEFDERRGHSSDVPSTLLLQCNSGVALNVRIGPLDSGQYQIGYDRGDSENTAGPILWTSRLQFDFVPLVRLSEPIKCIPTVAAQTVQERMLRAATVPLGLWWFIDRAISHRKLEALSRLTSETADDDRRNVIADNTLSSLVISIPIMYDNQRQDRHWIREVTLHYDPDKRSG